MNKSTHPPLSKFLKWFLILSAPIFAALVIWAMSIKEESTPELTFATDASTSQSLNGEFEQIPHIGTQEILKVPQIIYCLAEAIRLEAASGQKNPKNQDHTRRFNQMTADYQARCSSFKYKSKGGKSDLDSAKATVESRRTELEVAGRSRFK